MAGHRFGYGSLNATTNTATFTPQATLATNAQFNVHLTSGAKDVGGNALQDFAYVFQRRHTGWPGARDLLCHPEQIRCSGRFYGHECECSILIGDLGVAPGTSITGFLTGTFSGTEHVDRSDGQSGPGRPCGCVH